MSNSLWANGPQHARLPCPTLSPRVFSNSCPLSWWYYLTISILCHPLLLLPSIFPSIRVFSNELALPITWPEYWSFHFNISSSNEYTGLMSFRMSGLISLQSKGLSRVFLSTTVWKYKFFGTQPFLWSNSHIHMTTWKTIALTIQTSVGKVMSRFFNMLSKCILTNSVFLKMHTK